jgi:hypothetical protein
MAGKDGLGSAPQKLNLQMPNQFQSVDLLTNASQLQRPVSPCLSTSCRGERKSLTGACRNALIRSINDN